MKDEQNTNTNEGAGRAKCSVHGYQRFFDCPECLSLEAGKHKPIMVGAPSEPRDPYPAGSRLEVGATEIESDEAAPPPVEAPSLALDIEEAEETIPVPTPTGEPKPFKVHATRLDAGEGLMICGATFSTVARVFASAPAGKNVEACPTCEEKAKTVFAGERFGFMVEGFPDPDRHELLTVFTLDFTDTSTIKVAYPVCSCGGWNGAEQRFAHDISEVAILEELHSTHSDEHLRDLLTREPLAGETKREMILKLWESGTRDVAEIVRKVKARPSYVAQVLQQAGHLDGFFDLYTTTGREQNVYTRYFRNVLHFRNVEAARESVARIDRLYNYFERLGDRAGQHQAMILALTGKNRARWSGKMDESQVFSDWLNSH